MSKARVLIVEDQLIVAEDLAKLMEESGHEVIGICETGEEAVKTTYQASPDLVMVDIQLRGAIDGIEAVQQIRTQQDPAIVYLTAHSEKGLFERAKQTEPDGYLYKPVSPLELTRTVEIVLFKKKMETRLRESEEKYRELVETISDGIVQTDTVGTVTFANPAYCRMLGFTIEEIIGKSILD
ncbi:MAG: response regulator, partial [Desulfomonile tiedjei]|nr:response regulator [Desulfomonile tiedjei]